MSESLYEAMRKLDRRAKMHPHSPHVSRAGPIMHEFLGNGQGRMWMGMRKYGYVEIRMIDTTEIMARIGKHHWWWWRFDPEYQRLLMVLNRYRMERYSRDIQNAVITAWRA